MISGFLFVKGFVWKKDLCEDIFKHVSGQICEARYCL